MQPDKQPTPSFDKNISIDGDVVDSVVIAGNHNVVNKQTIIQRIINFILPTESESLEQRNRRILLNHVENAWIKGVLDASLHGATMLELGIKEDPEAVTKYPWAIKKESTDETLPTGTSMLEIFDSIGMGRSLLILGAPGSGKTTMLLELARGLISRAREDVTQPIPMVFNLSSWTESKTLADWLAQELNNLYSVPRKTAPDWVKKNKLLLLLDGLDEVRQESRAKCMEAINEFRRQNGLTSLAVCSRSQVYADLNTKLSFEGAIEVQPLTQEQIAEFFNRFGDEMAGIKQALEKDTALREMAETPLFLNIMLMAYRDKRDVEVLVSGDENARRKHLFDNYVIYMFERTDSNGQEAFDEKNILYWLTLLARKMKEHGQVQFLIERLQPSWLEQRPQIIHYRLLVGLSVGLFVGLLIGLLVGLSDGMSAGLFVGLLAGLVFGLYGGLIARIYTVDVVTWNPKMIVRSLIFISPAGLFIGLIVGMFSGVNFGLFTGLISWMYIGLIGGLISGMGLKEVSVTTYPGERLYLSAKSFLFTSLIFGLVFGLTFGILGGMLVGVIFGLGGGLLLGLISEHFIGVYNGEFNWKGSGGYTLLQHFSLRYVMSRNNLLPWRLVLFLDHCVDLIFLRRVGGGYIFIHRLLMEHFAEMYTEE